MYLTENWRLKDQRYTLKGTRSTETQTVTFPPRSVEPRSVEVYHFDTQDKPQQVDSAVIWETVK